MGTSKTSRLSEIVAGLDAHIGLARSYGLRESALLLGVAKLDLLMRIHGVSERELDGLCKAIEQQSEIGDAVAEPAAVSIDEQPSNVVSISRERRRRKASAQSVHPPVRGPVRTA